MRFHQVSITNVASLKGKHTIDFDKIMTHSHLFAITGPTGSGKSTILNSISLALYGQVYKKDSQSSDFVTLGESYGEIELCFSVSLHTYLAKWKLKVKKQNGEDLKRPQLVRELFELQNGNYTPTDKQIEDITKLNFNQFCKTTILNQGEFAKFLTSTFTERKEILEKFYHGDQLGLIGPLLKSKIQNAQQLKQETLHYIQGLEANLEENNFSDQDLKDVKFQKDKAQKQLEYLDQQSHYLKEAKTVHEQCEHAKQQKSDTNKLIISLESEFNRFLIQLDQKDKEFNERRNHLKNIKPKLNEAIKADIICQQTKEANKQSLIKLEKNDQQIKLQTEQLATLEINQKSITEKLNQFNSDLLNDLDIMVLRKDENELQIYQERLRSVEQQINTKHNELSQIQEKQKNLKKSFQDQSHQLEDLSLAIKSNEANLSDIEKIKKEYFEKKSIFLSIQTEIKTLEQEKEKYLTVKGKLQTNQEELTTLNKKLNAFHLDKKKSELEAAKNLCLEESEQNGECIVCQHKLPKKLQASFQLVEDTTQINLEIERVQSSIHKIERENDSFQLKIDFFKQNENKFIEKLRQGLGISYDSDLIKLKSEIEFKYQESEAQYKKTLLIEKDHLEKSNQLTILTQKLSNMQNQLDDLTSRSNKQTLDYNDLIKQQDLFQKNIKKTQEKYPVEIKKLINDLEASTKLAQEKDITDEKIKAFKGQLAQYNDIKSELKQTLKQQSEQIDEKEKFILSVSPKISPQLHLNKIEAELEQKAYELDQLKEQKRKLKSDIADKRNRTYLLSEQVQNLDLQISELNEKIRSANLAQIETTTALDDSVLKISQKLKDLKTENLNKEVIEQAYQYIQKLVEKIKKCIHESLEEISRLEAIKKQKVALKEKISEAKKKLDSSDDTLNSYLNLNELIGKDAFRSYVLSLVEKMLITQTNHELESLCQGRYRIIQDQGRYASEFKIQDHFLDQNIRKISTLSGGETFLVSLAMALALAELTRGEAKLDSLFIDEGFGTLDETTIEQVYNLLQEIQSSGKSIGIISHVQSLTQRLPVNIQLNKNINGLSNINLCLN